MRFVRAVVNIVQLPLELWWCIWTFPDDYYEGQEKDPVSTACYIALKIIWVLVTLLFTWLLICPLFGF